MVFSIVTFFIFNSTFSTLSNLVRAVRDIALRYRVRDNLHYREYLPQNKLPFSCDTIKNQLAFS